MGKVISFINDKGGVTKSTSTVCLASFFMSEGKRVAVVDVDARHSCLDCPLWLIKVATLPR